MLQGVLKMSEKDSVKNSPKKKYPNYQYDQFKIKATNVCNRCDRKFSFQVYQIDDARFVRFCTPCRNTIARGELDIDFTGTVGN